MHIRLIVTVVNDFSLNPCAVLDQEHGPDLAGKRHRWNPHVWRYCQHYQREGHFLNWHALVNFWSHQYTQVNEYVCPSLHFVVRKNVVGGTFAGVIGKSDSLGVPQGHHRFLEVDDQCALVRAMARHLLRWILGRRCHIAGPIGPGPHVVMISPHWIPGRDCSNVH